MCIFQVSTCLSKQFRGYNIVGAINSLGNLFTCIYGDGSPSPVHSYHVSSMRPPLWSPQEATAITQDFFIAKPERIRTRVSCKGGWTLAPLRQACARLINQKSLEISTPNFFRHWATKLVTSSEDRPKTSESHLISQYEILQVYGCPFDLKMQT